MREPHQIICERGMPAIKDFFQQTLFDDVREPSAAEAQSQNITNIMGNLLNEQDKSEEARRNDHMAIRVVMD